MHYHTHNVAVIQYVHVMCSWHIYYYAPSRTHSVLSAKRYALSLLVPSFVEVILRSSVDSLDYLPTSFRVASLANLPISFRVTSLALGQSYDCPSVSEVTPKDIGDIDQYYRKKSMNHIHTFLIYCTCESYQHIIWFSIMYLNRL